MTLEPSEASFQTSLGLDGSVLLGFMTGMYRIALLFSAFAAELKLKLSCCSLVPLLLLYSNACCLVNLTTTLFKVSDH